MSPSRTTVQSLVVLLLIVLVGISTGTSIGPITNSPPVAHAQNTLLNADANTTHDRPSTRVSANVSFGRSVIAEHRGDPIAIPVSLSQKTATISITAHTGGFQVTVTITDTDADRTVTIRVNTARRPSHPEFITVQGGTLSNLTYAAGARRATLLSRGRYTLHAATNTTPNSTATLVLLPRATHDITVYTGPATMPTESRHALLTHMTTRSAALDGIGGGDVIILHVEASGIFGDFSRAHLDADTSDGLALTFAEQDPHFRPPLTFSAATNTTLDTPINATVIPDSQNDSFFVALDTTGLATSPLNNALGTYTATFVVTPQFHGLVTTNESVNTTFTVEPARMTLHNGTNITVPQARTTISGTTNCAPGTTLTVTVKSSDGLLFLQRHDATVHPNGTFTAPFNFSFAPIGEDFRVLVEGTNANITGTVYSSRSYMTRRVDHVSHGMMAREPGRRARGRRAADVWRSGGRGAQLEAVMQSSPFTCDDV